MALPFFPQYFDNRNRNFKNHTLLESLTQYEVRKHCGMPRENAISLFEVIEPYIAHPTHRGRATHSETQYLTAMSFFRSGSFQYIESTVSGVFQSTVSRIIDRFSDSILSHLLPQYVEFPTTSVELNNFKTQFFEKAQFPNIFGIIDGTHVNIKGPRGEEEPAFVNRKLKHSINVQVTCSPNYSFTDVVVKWPGSTHDSFMWKQSGLRDRIMRGDFGEGWLLGDSGYPLEPWLMTPVDNPQTVAEKRYNRAQRVTRSLVERAIGVWKSRFRSMDLTGGALSYTPEKCCKLIGASVFLHNYCVRNKVALLQEDEEYRRRRPRENDPMTSPDAIFNFNCGVTTRQNLISNYFPGN